ICACTPRFEEAPESEQATVDDKGGIMKDGSVSADGYVINTIQPFSPPFNPDVKDPARRMLPSDLPTIGERLDQRMLDWAWYGGGWKNALADKPDKTFMHHHQPFIYFRAYGPSSIGRITHLKDEDDFIAAIEKGTLPAVSFYKPLGKVNLHPGYTGLKESEEHIFSIVKKIEQSPLWNQSLIVVTFDDAGGFWDHVAPPKGDRFGPGERIPALIISPVAKKGFIDHTVYDTTSILKLIETKYDLKPLGDRDAKANDMTNALE
ncbi:MAG: acid phosphatase, partial [Candidatus Sungbacteria bacterium]|nr:acid phosphatase [Candidatus Sungbacteria bacterium]